jgi:Cys-tRNA(Pro)/Cys-tRNA(Cys) deacylase
VLGKEVYIAMAITKTNAMRILDAEKISYSVHTYENKDGKMDGISVAGKIGKEIEMVYKTLVVKDTGNGIYVFVIPVEAELDLKKAAKVVNAKKLEMIAVKDIQKTTGYIRGGCSPIGMKKKYETILDESVNKQSTIIVSGGKIGVQIELAVNNLIQVTEARVEDVIH